MSGCRSLAVVLAVLSFSDVHGQQNKYNVQYPTYMQNTQYAQNNQNILNLVPITTPASNFNSHEKNIIFPAQETQQQQPTQPQYQPSQQSYLVQQTPPPSQGQPQFRYNEASFAVTDLARRVGTVLGQTSNAAVFSPVSIACALSLLLLAANKDTKQELLEVLNFNPNEQQTNEIHRQYGRLLHDVASNAPDKIPVPWRQLDRCSEEEDEEYKEENTVIHLANAVFVKQDFPLSKKFAQLSQNFYNSSVRPQDFAGNPQGSAFNINRWASDNTYGKINQIVSNFISTDTQMIVANALYFKGLWKEMFEKQATTFRKFYPDGYANPSSAKDVLTMAVIGCYPYYDAVEYGAKIVGLPYQGSKTALYIIIPNNSSRENLQRFQSTLTGQNIGDMVSKMRVKKTLIQMPKMKISNTINLRDVLQKLNLRSIFSAGSSDLSGMLESGPNGLNQRLYASEIVHKVELEINEKGTEGGAVTSSTIFRSLPSVQVRIDTPFVMLLGHDETQLPLFYGSIYDPSSS